MKRFITLAFTIIGALLLAAHSTYYYHNNKNGETLLQKNRNNNNLPRSLLGGIHGHEKTLSTLSHVLDPKTVHLRVQTPLGQKSNTLYNTNNNLCGCPAGDYTSREEHDRRTDILRMWCSWLTEEQGFINTDTSRVHYSHNRTWWYYEHPSWPKPSHCNRPNEEHIGAQLVAQHPQEWDSPCSGENKVLATYMPTIELIFFHPPKTGSITIEKYLQSQGGETDYCCPKGHTFRKCVCVAEKPKRVSTVVLSTRPPIERFISGVGEVLARKSSHIWKSGKYNTREICLDRHGLEIGGNPTSLAECIIREHECVPSYSASSHLYSQGFFASRQGFNPPAPGELDDGPYIDRIVPNHDINNQVPLSLTYSADRAGVSGFQDPPPIGKKFNTAGEKGEDVKQIVLALKALLQESQQVSSILCRMYMSDFVCFDHMEIPPLCQAMLDGATSWYDTTYH